MHRNCSAWVAALDAGHLGPPHSEGRAAPGWRTYSQSYQDGVLERIFKLFGIDFNMRQVYERFLTIPVSYTHLTLPTKRIV